MLQFNSLIDAIVCSHVGPHSLRLHSVLALLVAFACNSHAAAC